MIDVAEVLLERHLRHIHGMRPGPAGPRLGGVAHQDAPFPWPPASATGIGSMPGTDPAEAARVVLGELPDLPHLPELPARGPGAELAGRAVALLVDMPAAVTPAGWRLAGSAGRDLSRARSYLSHDLDALEEAAEGYQGPLKIQVCGPWTLAASVELPSQQPALADPGATRDLAESLAEGVAAHAGDVARRIPGARILLQLDEPSLPAVLGGGVPTASGLRRLPPAEEAVVTGGLESMLARVRDRSPGREHEPFCIIHCCAAGVPFGLIRGAGAQAVSFDSRLLRRHDEDPLAEAAEAGLGLLAGVADFAAERRGGEPTSPSNGASVKETMMPVAGLWRRLGLPPRQAADQVVLTPACGLAGAGGDAARAALARCREAARALAEEMAG